jgi:hypothetical protein
VRRLTKSLLLAAAILLFGCLVAACGRSVGGAIASLAPSRSASISPPSPSPSISPPSASPTISPSPSPTISPSPSPTIAPPSPSASVTAQPSATQSAIAPATSAQSSSPLATSSGTSSSLIWLWIIIGALALIGVIVWIARASGRRSAVAGEWQSRVVDAYAKSAALYESMRAAETPGAMAAADAGARWSDLQRRTDDLTQLLYALREVAPDEDKRARVSDVLASVRDARAAMDAERAPGGADERNAQVVRSRLLSFEASIRALRAPDEPHL